jgi:predicted PurR-regulated permease PerM
MARGDPGAGQDPAQQEDHRASPTGIASPELRLEAQRAGIWVAVVGSTLLAVYVAQSLLVIFGAMVFAALVDGGARLLGRVLPIGRGLRIGLVLIATVAFFAWLGLFAGSQISQEAAQLPAIVGTQAGRLLGWLQGQGFAITADDVQNFAGQLMSGVGMVTRAIGGIFGAFTLLLLIVIIGIYVAFEPRLYERGLAWMLPREERAEFHITLMRMAETMRRLMAGRLVGMVFEGLFTWIMLWAYGVPMAALLGILTGLLAFIPNIGAVTAGLLMVTVGFSGSVDMGFYTIFVYLLVQTFDGYVVIPLIARRTVDLAPALVLGAQLIMSVLFGILGLFLADPLMAMIKVALDRRSERADQRERLSADDDGA